MSNHLAVAMVTEALRRVIESELVKTVSGATVIAQRPDSSGASPAEPQVRLYLYQITPNPHWRGDDLPTCRSDGRVQQRPQAAIDLHYLLTFYGNDSIHEPQRMLGSVIGVLHSRPVLSRELINSIIGGFSGNHELAKSDLANQIDQVRVTPSPLNLEEMSKLWSSMLQSSYELSITYQASVVLIETQDIPSTPLPVKHYGVYVLPFPQPIITKVIAASGEYDPIQSGSQIFIQGQGLDGEFTALSISGHDFTSAITEQQSAQITVQLPDVLPANMHAGIHSVRITRELNIGQPATPHTGFESNVVAFVLRPTLDPPPALSGVPVVTQVGGIDYYQGTIQVHFNPAVGLHQQVVLLMNEKTSASTAQAYSFSAPENNGIDTAAANETNLIDFAFEKVRSGDYLLRIQVDGAESPLVQNQAGEYVQPMVTI